MILKGNIRASGQKLATHLMNDQDNERVELAEVRGFASPDLSGAFAEAEGVASGTNCTKYLYSLSINPSKELSREEYGHAIEKIEKKLGLEDQSRAVVFHIKEGREHAHVAWSRIDDEKMKAVHMAFDRQMLREVARELVRDFGHEMPKYLGEDRGTDRYKEKFNDQTLAEKAQAERSGITPQDRRNQIGEAYQIADSAAAFRYALQERGYILAEGDKRGFVVVDVAGDVHSLTRQIEGVTAKEIRSNLKLDMIEGLPSVQQAKEQIAELTRQNALEASQDRPDSPDRVALAETAMNATTDAQAAELKAIKGDYADQLTGLRDEQAERINDAHTAIKSAYRPEWAQLFKQQRAELQEITDHLKNPVGRLKWMMSNPDYDLLDTTNKGHLAKAFDFVVLGKADLSKVEKAHTAQKRELGDMQKLAERSEIREIKQEITENRTRTREDHKDNLSVVKSTHADELTDAAKNLKRAREMSERDGTDLSRGEKRARDTAVQFGFGKQGFGKQGFNFGRDQEREDRDELEREIKPPGQDLTPK